MIAGPEEKFKSASQGGLTVQDGCYGKRAGSQCCKNFLEPDDDGSDSLWNASGKYLFQVGSIQKTSLLFRGEDYTPGIVLPGASYSGFKLGQELHSYGVDRSSGIDGHCGDH